MALQPVRTLDDLRAVDTRKLDELTICEVTDLPETPAKLPWSEKHHWTKRLVFTRTPNAADEDTIFAAPTGGFWIRARDIG